MTELKPCPFCDGAVKWCGDSEEEPHDCDQIICGECGMSFNSYHDTVRNAESLEEAKKAMSKLWNTRECQE